MSNRQRILVVGGGGAVGFSAIQLAVAAGCSVRTTCGSQSVERMLAAGAEQAVDYLSEVVLNFLLYYISKHLFRYYNNHRHCYYILFYEIK